MLKRVIILVFSGLIVTSAILYFLAPGIIKRRIRTELYTKSKIEIDYDQIKIHSLIPVKVSIANLKLKKMNDINIFVKSATTEINLKDILLNLDNKNIQYSMIIDDINLNYKDTSLPTDPVQPATPVSPIMIGDFKDFLKNSYGISELNFLFKIKKI